MMGNSSFYSSVCGAPKMETPRNYDFYGFQIIYLEDKNISDPKTNFKDHDVISSIFTSHDQIWILIYGLH